MDDYINEEFLDMILSEYPNAAEDIFFGDDEDAPDSLLFNAVTIAKFPGCLLYTSPSPRDKRQSRMPSSA